jgi:hypothetical protein
MEHAKELACQYLDSLGLSVAEIPESVGKRADLRAIDDTAEYVIEVKQRLEDPVLREAHVQKMSVGEIVNTTESHSYSDRLDGILKHGSKQIDETPKDCNAFNLIWFHAEGRDSDLKIRRARNTFYGLVPLLPLRQAASETVDCFYFDFCTSIRMPTVHGLVLVDEAGLQLCVNEFGTGVERFRRSSLVQRLHEGVLDPAVLEAQGDAIVFRSEISRKDERAVLVELERVTNQKFISIRLKRHASSAMVPRTDST